MKNTNRIKTLTSLRFFAAVMIVLVHTTNGQFFDSRYLNSFSLMNGVSLFFILSGFILTYVYPQLDQDDILTFIKARIARIWPAHIAAIALFIILVPYIRYIIKDNISSLFATILLLQSWIPLQNFYSIYNIPSWSISNELFYYLCFPILIFRFKESWHIKLLLSIFLIIGMIMVCTINQFPLSSATTYDIMSSMYIHPLPRLFEFVLGMCAAVIFFQLRNKIQLTFIQASLLELTCLIAILCTIKFIPGSPLVKHLNSALLVWINYAGCSCVFFSMFILILAFQRGVISMMLQLPVFLLLGEMSYSLYLIHYTFIYFFEIHKPWFYHLHTGVIYSLYWLCILASSYLMWRFIEMPGRRLLMNFSIRSTLRKIAISSA